MFRFLYALIITSSITVGATAQQGVDHTPWTKLLQKYVSPYGLVNYKGLKADEAALNAYLKVLQENPPTTAWKNDEQEAYWINAYNAFTIKLVLKHYPLKSIMDIKEDGKDAWHIPFIKIGGKMYTLDYIENTMLRAQFNDARIHFVINCSAISCPPLKNSAYTAQNLGLELRLAARRFVNDDRFNILSASHLQLSQIFNWYKDDFLKEGTSIQDFIEINTPHLSVDKKASISYLEYDWKLNEQ